MTLEIKHLQTSEADEISRLRKENAELKAKNAQLEDDVAFWKAKCKELKPIQSDKTLQERLNEVCKKRD